MHNIDRLTQPAQETLRAVGPRFEVVSALEIAKRRWPDNPVWTRRHGRAEARRHVSIKGILANVNHEAVTLCCNLTYFEDYLPLARRALLNPVRTGHYAISSSGQKVLLEVGCETSGELSDANTALLDYYLVSVDALRDEDEERAFTALETLHFYAVNRTGMAGLSFPDFDAGMMPTPSQIPKELLESFDRRRLQFFVTSLETLIDGPHIRDPRLEVGVARMIYEFLDCLDVGQTGEDVEPWPQYNRSETLAWLFRKLCRLWRDVPLRRVARSIITESMVMLDTDRNVRPLGIIVQEIGRPLQDRDRPRAFDVQWYGSKLKRAKSART